MKMVLPEIHRIYLYSQLRSQLVQFFMDYEKEYLFVLSNKDYDQDGTKKFYCLCFNDNHDEGKQTNFLIKFLMKRTDANGYVSTVIDQPGDCQFLGDLSVRELADHYLDHHTAKLYEFLRHIALKSSDQKMKNIASKILLNWDEKEEGLIEETSQPDDRELQILEEQANMVSFPLANCSTIYSRSKSG